MLKRCTCLALLLPILLLACSGNSDNSVSDATLGSALTATLADTMETHLLRDDLQYLGIVLHAISVGDNRLVVADNQSTVALFENHVMTRTFGGQGEGPCEFGNSRGLTAITAIDTSGDSLFVLASPQMKIITFSLGTGECLGETSHPDLIQRRYMRRVDGGFLTGRAMLSPSLHDTTRLVSLLKDDGRMVPLDLDLRSIDAVNNPLPIIIPGSNFAGSGDQLYAIFPFTHRMATIDLPSMNVGTLPLHIEIYSEALDELEDGIMSNPSQLREAIEKSEIALNLHASQRWIAVSIQSIGSEGETLRRLLFHNIEGELIGTERVELHPLTLQGERLIFIEPVQDPESDYTYQVTYRRVTIE